MKDIKLNLRFFDNTNLSTDAVVGNDLSPSMKEFYDKNLLENAKTVLVHTQFGQEKPIPKGNGKTIKFRKFTPFEKALTPLTEGVTPSGRKLTMTEIVGTVNQYGDYVETSDILSLVAMDNALIEAGKLLGDQAGRTLDTIAREVLNGGTNVQYHEGEITARHLLAGGEEADNDYFSMDCALEAVRNLKNNKAKEINGEFVGIAHVNTIADIMRYDEDWKDAVKYSHAEKIYNGEVGKAFNVRFVETTEAKIFHAKDLSVAKRELTVKSVSGKVITINETLTAEDMEAIAGRKILVAGNVYTVVSATANAITVEETLDAGVVANAVIYPGEAGAKGREVYSTLILGADAYGNTSLEGGALEFIVKQLGSSGTADPLNQRATTGWKATAGCVRLSETAMVRVEHTASKTGFVD